VALFERGPAEPLGAGLVRVGDELITASGAAALVIAPLDRRPPRRVPGPADATIVALFGGPRLTALSITATGAALEDDRSGQRRPARALGHPRRADRSTARRRRRRGLRLPRRHRLAPGHPALSPGPGLGSLTGP
jgi:hypothetical protein